MYISWNWPKDDLCIYNYSSNSFVNARKFKKIHNILYSINHSLYLIIDYHLYYQQIFLNYSNIDHLLESDFKRISLSDSYSLNNPKYLFVSLLFYDTVTFGIFDNTKKYKWKIQNKNIINNHKYLNIENNKLIMSTNKTEWIICENSLIKNVEHELYLSCDINYNIILTKDINEAISFHFENDGIHYIKPKINVDFEMNNIRGLVNIPNIYKIQNKYQHKVGLLLAAGTSSRFSYNLPKQLYKISHIPIIMYSIEALIDIVDKLVIVTNLQCLDEVTNLTKNYKNIIVIINNNNCRLKSIESGLIYIKNLYKHVNNRIIIHDAARPFVKGEHIQKLIDDDNVYSQYYLKLVNGLYSCNNKEMLDRDKYIEICTPIVANFHLYYFIFMNYIAEPYRIVYEHIPILDLLKIKYNLIQGNHKYLKKITYIDDIIN